MVGGGCPVPGSEVDASELPGRAADMSEAGPLPGDLDGEPDQRRRGVVSSARRTQEEERAGDRESLPSNKPRTVT